ncbi:hypothetical protein [Dietzia sp. ANT_WB102]|uniref:hypothetical protein n=1 Tax=Dietzia sp. ANT_WB102 TaxID=2597345 RepID=UPI00165E1896|nr:hypothetical protein [Dietzia sp. ANT_WB102]
MAADWNADDAADAPVGVLTENGAGRVSGALWEPWSLREIEDEAASWRNLHPDHEVDE